MLEQIEARLDSHLAALAKHEGNNAPRRYRPADYCTLEVADIVGDRGCLTFIVAAVHQRRGVRNGSAFSSASSSTCDCASAENPELVHQLEKAKEKQRRERARQDKLAEQHFKSDERLQASC